MLTIDDIRIYPVKGLRGFSIAEAGVEPWGLAHDRRWMIVDRSGQFLTQRQVPRMAVISADLMAGGMRLSVEGGLAIEEPTPDRDAEAIEVIVWKDQVRARSASRRAADWLTGVLGMPCRLVHMDNPAEARATDTAFSDPGDRVSFADGFPLLATTSASLADLNCRLPRPASMDRFRPNIVIGGAEPWAEDRWTSLRVGGLAFSAVKDCARCVVTTVDQETGVKGADGEPLRTLATFRRRSGGRIIFGQNMIPRDLGRISVGDRVEVAD